MKTRPAPVYRQFLRDLQDLLKDNGDGDLMVVLKAVIKVSKVSKVLKAVLKVVMAYMHKASSRMKLVVRLKLLEQFLLIIIPKRM